MSGRLNAIALKALGPNGGERRADVGIRRLERDSIRGFLEGHMEKMGGRVLDYGCGKQPYRAVVEEAGGDYHGFDLVEFPGSVVTADVFAEAEAGTFDVVICTQVIQYVPVPTQLLDDIGLAMHPESVLLMTGPTNWPVVEETDLWRFTVPGIRWFLELSGFRVADAHYRAEISHGGERWPLGWAVEAYIE